MCSGSGKYCLWKPRSEVRKFASVTSRKVGKEATEKWKLLEKMWVLKLMMKTLKHDQLLQGSGYIGKGLCSKWFCRQHLRNLQYLELHRRGFIYWVIRKAVRKRSGFQWKVVFIFIDLFKTYLLGYYSMLCLVQSSGDIAMKKKIRSLPSQNLSFSN